MKTSRHIFSNYLGAESGCEARRQFDSVAIRNSLLTELPSEFQAVDLTQPTDLNKLSGVVGERFDPIRNRFLKLEEAIKGSSEQSNALRSKAALEVAPFFIGSQYLIHSICGNWNNESRYAMATLRVHASDVSIGQPGASRISRYEELLRSYSLADTVTELLHSGTDQRISEGAFSFPASLVILGHFPESLAGEILGVNLFLRQCGVLPPLGFIANGKLDLNTFLDFGNDPQGQPGELKELAAMAVSEFSAQSCDQGRASVLIGYHWAQTQLEEICINIAAVLEQWLDPREAARQLITNRNVDACQYHEKTKLNKVSMQSLLQNDDSLAFLDQLAASGFVKEGKPELSPLLNKLISPKGKMFRIFSRDDVSVLNRWIKNQPYNTPPAQEAAYLMWKDTAQMVKAFIHDQNATGIDPKTDSIRERYHRLLHMEISPADEEFSQRHVNNWLKMSARDVADKRCPLPNRWQPGTLQPWLQSRHDASNKALDDDYDLPSKADVTADILSLAPLTMIDGAWLIGFIHPELASSSYGFRLCETFYDELGNGIEKQNHPVIYRELLKVVHGEMPATADPSFAMNSCFKDKDFELPSFWLSIGRYPQTYTPEILGLNLAMELSGVGGGYRRTHKALVAYRFPTMFVDLHNTIDNISTGHTAWAAASIDTFMSACPSSQHLEIWRRICTGFVALNPSRKKNMFDNFKEKMGSIL